MHLEKQVDKECTCQKAGAFFIGAANMRFGELGFPSKRNDRFELLKNRKLA